MIPEQHRNFVHQLLDEHGVPQLPEDQQGARADRVDRGDRRPADRDRADPSEGAADRQRARHPAARHRRRDPVDRTARRRAVRLGQAGAVAQGCRPRLHHRPGHRGRRPHRRRRFDRAVARGDRRGVAHARARCRWHRIGSSDGGRDGDGRRGRVDRVAVADGRGSRDAAVAAGRAPRRAPAATPFARAAGPASRAACSAATGPRRGSRPTTPSRSACRCSSWSPAKRWPGPRSTPTRRPASASTRWARWSGRMNKIRKHA